MWDIFGRLEHPYSAYERWFPTIAFVYDLRWLATMGAKHRSCRAVGIARNVSRCTPVILRGMLRPHVIHTFRFALGHFVI